MVKRFFYKLLVVIVVVLSVLIISKKSLKMRNVIHKNVFEHTMSFSKMNMLYTKYLGPILPFKLNVGLEPVFNETLTYDSIQDYLSGVLLNVHDNYLIPALKDGIVIFEGIKDGTNTIIILGDDGVEVWYGNISNTVKIYDYVSKGSYIGNSIGDKLYLTFKKNGDILDYHEYIN